MSKFTDDRETFAKRGLGKLLIRGACAFTGAYGPREQVPGTKAPTNAVHAGIDVAATEGTPILSLSDGIVFRSQKMKDGALEVIVGNLSDGWRYVHNSRNIAGKGARVFAGQHIADVGSTGNVNGAHVHLERLINGVAVDPLPHLIRLSTKLDVPNDHPVIDWNDTVKIVQIQQPDGRTYLVAPGSKRHLQSTATVAALAKVYGPPIVVSPADALAIFTETDRL